MRWMFILLAAGLLLCGCKGTPKPVITPDRLAGSWELVSTLHNGVARSHTGMEVRYRFSVDGVLVTSAGAERITGRYTLQGQQLTAWWPGRHREVHEVRELSAALLVLVSRDGRLLSRFRRLP